MKRICSRIVSVAVMLSVFVSAVHITTAEPAFVTQPMLAPGFAHTLALKSDGMVWAWGNNSVGQLGDGTDGHENSRTTPAQVLGLTEVVDLSAGAAFSVALRSDGTVWTWGNNSGGQLGDGTTTNRSIPAQVLTDVVAISAGFTFAAALKSDGTVWTWGNNQHGQLGDGTEINYRTTPIQVPGLTEVSAISAAYHRTIVLKSDGTVWAWGRNYGGQLGDGTMTNSSIPVQALNLTDITYISAGFANTLALKSDGTIWAWGSNLFGLPGEETIYHTAPVLVSDLDEEGQIILGEAFTFIIKSDSTVWAWGYNYYGSLGNGTKQDSTTPVQVSGLSGIVDVSARGLYAVALKRDGTVWAWGHNDNGQLGDGTTTQRNAPVQVLGEDGVGWLNLGATPLRIRGHVLGNETTDVADIIAVRSHILGSGRLSGNALWAADANDDGVINIFDMITIRNMILRRRNNAELRMQNAELPSPSC